MKAKVMIQAVALSVLALVAGWLVASTALAAGGVVIRKPLPSVREVGPRHDFLKLLLDSGVDGLPFGCDWVKRDGPIVGLEIDCSDASPLTGFELVCSQSPRQRHSLERQHGIDCGE